MKKPVFIILLLLAAKSSFCWGFFGHQKINGLAVFLLPPEMVGYYKMNFSFISEHAVDPDKRRYSVAEEGPRHYIDIDNYGKYPFPELPRRWNDALAKFGEDTLQANGIVPWWIQVMQRRLVEAFKEKNGPRILKISAELGHYIADSHVPLHTSNNHDGQLTNQKGIHGFWESRVPEMLADKEWDFFIGKAQYISNVEDFVWKRVLESAAAADSVLRFEKVLSTQFASDKKFSFENRNGNTVRQYSTAYAKAYDAMLNGMVERRMRQSIFAVASFWYTAWVDAGQPDLRTLSQQAFTEADMKEFENLNAAWRNQSIIGRTEEQ
ncbi:MAG: zinc dependent phospholipase C family protein [Flavisolibacter sp.]